MKKYFLVCYVCSLGFVSFCFCFYGCYIQFASLYFGLLSVAYFWPENLTIALKMKRWLGTGARAEVTVVCCAPTPQLRGSLSPWEAWAAV